MAILRNNNKILKQNYKPLLTIGKGLKFDGVNDYVSLPNMALSTNYTDSFSIYMIASITSFTQNKLLFITTNQTSDTKGVYFQILSGGSKFILTFFTNGGRGISYECTFNFNQNVVYHLCASFSNGFCDMYINGVSYSFSKVAFGGYSPTDDTTSTTIYSVFARAVFYTNYTAGKCYDLKIFNKALTQDEVIKLYNSNNNLIPNTAYPNLVANYNFNHKQGTSLIDSSENSLNGTLINFTVSDTTLGVNNKWVDENGNSILL